MQVRKFEARTMKEALEMVKAQLGPDAIILSARDNAKTHGLIGQGSVEITAAISENTLRKKQYAESKMNATTKAQLDRSPARVQKQVINNFVEQYHASQVVAEKHVAPEGRQIGQPRGPTQQRYIDINDEVDGMMSNAANERIKNAAQKAWNAMQAHGGWMEDELPQAPQQSSAALQQSAARPPLTQVNLENGEIRALKGEIESLKTILSQFQSMPQSFVSQHPGAQYGLTFDVAPMYEKLVQAGIAEDIAAELLVKAQNTMTPVKLKNKSLVDAWVARQILDTTLVSGEKNTAKIHAFVGPSGSGKTSTLVKMASHFVIKEGKRIAILSCDTFKVGSCDQMRTYAQILNVPFGIIRTQGDWEKALAVLAGYDHILVDYPGMSLKNLDEISIVRNLLPQQQLGCQVHLVLSCVSKDSDLTEIGKRYKVADYSDVIFTCLDESIQHGNVYNFMTRFGKPVHSFGIGSRVPEDFEVATKERVLDLIFKLTKVKKD